MRAEDWSADLYVKGRFTRSPSICLRGEKGIISAVNFRPTAEQEELREAVRSFLRDDPAVGARPFPEDGWIAGFDPDFSRRLAERGWVGMTWPTRYGGSARRKSQRHRATRSASCPGAKRTPTRARASAISWLAAVASGMPSNAVIASDGRVQMR